MVFKGLSALIKTLLPTNQIGFGSAIFKCVEFEHIGPIEFKENKSVHLEF